MPEGRFVSRGIAHSEQLAAVPLEADFLFTRCIPHLDRDGRMSGNPTIIKAMVCPLRPEITPGSIPDLVRTLSGVGLVRWYECDGKQILEFPKFAAHQKGMKYDREAASRYPAFDSKCCIDLTTQTENHKSGPNPDEVRTRSGSSPPKLSLSEVEVKETDTLSNESGGNEPAAIVDNPPPVGTTETASPGELRAGDLMGMCRKLLYGPGKKPPKDRSEGQDMNTIKTLLAGNVKPERIAAAIEAASAMRDAGACNFVKRGEPMSMGVLVFKAKATDTGWTPRPFWNECLEWHQKWHQGERGPPPNMKLVGDAMRKMIQQSEKTA